MATAIVVIRQYLDFLAFQLNVELPCGVYRLAVRARRAGRELVLFRKGGLQPNRRSILQRHALQASRRLYVQGSND